MKVDYEVTQVTETGGSMDATVNDQIKCPICGDLRFTVFVHMSDYIDLVCQDCHAHIHILSIEGK